MKMYGFGATRSLRALWAVNELGLDVEFINLDLLAGEHKRPEFLRVNPAGKVPVLVDGDAVIPESAAIVMYLAEKFPQKGLMPLEPKARAQVYRWIMFAMTELEPPLYRIFRHTNLYPEHQRLPADVALARAELDTMAAVLDRHLEARDFVVGSEVTAADLVLAYVIDWANEEGALAGHANLAAYLERMYSRPTAPPRIRAALAQIQAAASSPAPVRR